MQQRIAAPLFVFAFLATYSVSARGEECSTEKVNHNCTLTINRQYPIAVPTIQMRPHDKVTVVVLHPLPFEILTLDFQNAQAVAGTDQLAGLITTAVPYLKSFVLLTSVEGFTKSMMTENFTPGFVAAPDPNFRKVEMELDALKKSIDDASEPLARYGEDAKVVYLQLQEVMSPIPRPSTTGGAGVARPPEIGQTPNPWDRYKEWRQWMIYELVASPCDSPPCPQIANLLGRGADLQFKLTSTSKTGMPSDYPIFDSKASRDFDAKAAAIRAEIDALMPVDKAEEEEKKHDVATLEQIVRYKKEFVGLLPSYAGAISAIEQDLQKYAANIYQTPEQAPDKLILGDVNDVAKDDQGVGLRILGRQIQYSINAVNNVSTPIASVPSATQRKAVVTITVLYADPIFEASAGVFFSGLANRSFANLTTVTQNPGGSPIPGDVVITQTVTRPTVVPFAAANFRLGPTWAYPDQRRGAFYVTAGVGFNTYSNAAEFGFGPSFSWRSVMLTPMLHLGRDLRLTQGEFIGEVWCNVTAGHGNVPKCSGNPPSPSSERYWRPAFAIGLSVRVPSVFGGH
jgi:hypothetical protein